MSNQLVIDSSELRTEFRSLLDSLQGAGEAGRIVEGTGNAAAVDIKAAYPVRTGRLRDRVKVTFSGSGYSSKAVVKSTSPLAWIFENGTQARHTSIGANRGSMPPGHVFIPRAIKWRSRMYERFMELLTRHGLIVTGDA